MNFPSRHKDVEQHRRLYPGVLIKWDRGDGEPYFCSGDHDAFEDHKWELVPRYTEGQSR